MPVVYTDPPIPLRQLLEEKREDEGLKQGDIGKILGVEQATVSLYERNEKRLKGRGIDFVVNFFRAYRFSEDEVLSFTGSLFEKEVKLLYSLLNQGSSKGFDDISVGELDFHTLLLQNVLGSRSSVKLEPINPRLIRAYDLTVTEDGKGTMTLKKEENVYLNDVLDQTPVSVIHLKNERNQIVRTLVVEMENGEHMLTPEPGDTIILETDGLGTVIAFINAIKGSTFSLEVNGKAEILQKSEFVLIGVALFEQKWLKKRK